MSIQSVRKSRGLTQRQLAEMIGVEQATVSRMESGEEGITMRIINATAEALDVSLSDLFAADRGEAEEALIRAYNKLTFDQKLAWFEMARGLSSLSR